jgi:hypothetical protein
MELFNASTVVTVGNGHSAVFWTSSWINGRTAKSIAPRLFAKCKRKEISVHKALIGNKWIEHLLPIATREELVEYVELLEAIHQIQLNNDIENAIRWRWTVDGEYTTSRAYKVQFTGTYSKLRLTPIWRARTEQKYRFFFFCLETASPQDFNG